MQERMRAKLKAIPTMPMERSTDPKGNITEKVYDKVGRLFKVINGSDVTSYMYYNNGNTARVTYSNSFKEVYIYYANNQLKSLVNLDADGTTMDSYRYTYDNAGNQLTKYELINQRIYKRYNRLYL